MRLVLKNKSSSGFLSALWILVVGLMLSSANSCTHEGLPADQMEEICFTRQVLPIFQNSCATSGCHDATTAEEGYVFTDYANIMKSIEPGDASKSKAYKAITSHSETMPPDVPLPIDKRILIRLWIEQGAKETTCQSNTSLNIPANRQELKLEDIDLKNHSTITNQVAYAKEKGKASNIIH